MAFLNRFEALGALEDPVELWDTFKRETLAAAEDSIGARPRQLWARFSVLICIKLCSLVGFGTVKAE